MDGSTPLIFNTEAYPDGGKQPTSVADIFNTTDFPGPRCIWSYFEASSNNLEMALIADGVPMDQLYEVLSTDEGLQRAIAKLDTIKDDIIFLDTGAESVQFVLDGQCDLGMTWNGRPALRIKDEPDLPMAMVHQGAQLWEAFMAIPEGTDDKHYKAAMSNLAYMLQPRNECDLLNNLGYGLLMSAPPFPDCLEDFAKEFGPHPEEGYAADYAWYTENNDRLSEAWNAWKTE